MGQEISTSDTSRLVEADARQVLRLFDGVTDLPPDPDERQRHLLKGMCEVIKAAAAQWITCQVNSPDDPGTIHSNITVSQSDDLRDSLETCISNCFSTPLCAPAIRQSMPLQTCCCREVEAGSGRYPCCHHQTGQCPAELGSRVCSVLRLPAPGSFRVIKFYRHRGEEQFSDRHREIVHAFHEMTFVFRVLIQPSEKKAPVVLPEHLQRLLAHVLGGNSEKEISRLTGLSQHTVHAYIRTIYRQFQVTSRAELMARWVSLSNDYR